MDLDDEELEATRKLHESNRKKEKIENIRFFLGDLKASNYNQSFIQDVENLIKENEDLKEDSIPITTLEKIIRKYEKTELSNTENIINFYKEIKELL